MLKTTKHLVLCMILLIFMQTQAKAKKHQGTQTKITNIKSKSVYHTFGAFIKAGICIKALKNSHEFYKQIDALKLKGLPKNHDEFLKCFDNYFNLSAFLFIAFIAGKSSSDSVIKVLQSTYYH